ncbi:MAG: hypothetical protein IT285_09980 [Bdellovibrionales bacterium]|nr:hypothetical protein [Bdellovibrionales bacterium]
MDQAETLRRIMEDRQAASDPEPTQAGPPTSTVFSVCSARPGAGKSLVATHLASLWARAGSRVLLANSGWNGSDLAPLDAYEQGSDARFLKPWESRLLAARLSPDFLRASRDTGLLESGVAARLAKLGESAERLILECGAEETFGEGGPIHRPSWQHVIVLTPDCLAAAQALLSHLRREAGVSRARIVLNQVKGAREGRRLFNGLARSAIRRGEVQLEYLGSIPRDEKIPATLSAGKSLIDCYPGASATACLRLMHKRLDVSARRPAGSIGNRADRVYG